MPANLRSPGARNERYSIFDKNFPSVEGEKQINSKEDAKKEGSEGGGGGGFEVIL